MEQFGRSCKRIALGKSKTGFSPVAKVLGQFVTDYFASQLNPELYTHKGKVDVLKTV